MAVCTDDDFIFHLCLDIEVGCTCTLILALLFCRKGSVSLLRSFPKFTKAVARVATDACHLDFKWCFCKFPNISYSMPKNSYQLF